MISDDLMVGCFGPHREKIAPMVEILFFKNRIFMIKMSIIFVNTPSSMVFMMGKRIGCKNQPCSYTRTPKTAR